MLYYVKALQSEDLNLEENKHLHHTLNIRTKENQSWSKKKQRTLAITKSEVRIGKVANC